MPQKERERERERESEKSVLPERLDDDEIGARGVMLIVARNGHGDTSSNPGRD